jgi:hypothetical protein
MRRAMVLAVLLTFVAIAPVAAAAPNETVATAMEVFVGDDITQDTTTSDATDPGETALNGNCGAPVVEHGVWFKITGTAAVPFVAFDTTESDYGAGIMVFEGTPGSDTFITCGPGRVGAGLAEGVEYNVMVFGDGTTAETAGSLVLHVVAAAAPPTLEVTINRSATVNRLGEVHLSGTITCTSDDGSGTIVDVFGDITQRVGRLLIRGFFDTFLDLPCDGTTQVWDAFAIGDNGVFAGGKAVTVAIGFACTDFCSEGFVQATIQLKRSGK